MISMTQNAAEHIKRSMLANEQATGIRLGVKATGCSGLAYVVEFIDTPSDDDILIPLFEINVFIDSKSAVFLKGIELDFIRNGLNENFVFNNPNAKGMCGCGESFQI